MTIRMRLASSVLAAGLILPSAAQTQASVTADFSAARTPVSKNLFGIFYEDINYAADGGLYGEMVQNRSFEYTPEGKTAFWQDQLNISGAASKSRLSLSKKGGLHPNNPTFVQFTALAAGDGFCNNGYNGMYVQAGKTYPGSVWLKSSDSSVSSITVTLENSETKAKLSTAKITGIGTDWKKYTFTLTAAETTGAGRIALYLDQAGTVSADFISLFTADIYKNEPNGLRKDLADMLEAMHPAFIRFPGGCIVHGHKLSDRYQWKNTIGPVEQRKETPNFWAGKVPYQQSYGLGFYEYFRLCEDLKAEPIPVLSVGMSHDGERSPASEYSWYAQDALDMIEWATGPADSTWGRLRAEAGHPEPFPLHYIGIGNEDCGREYLDRFAYIAGEIKKKYPDIKLIISSGFTYNDINFHNTWKQVRAWENSPATRSLAALVDEHYYNPYSWFLTNGARYDNLEFYPRGEDKAKVFIGEYASWVDGRRNNLYAALTEAAYMTGIERNGDIVEIASYAPLFAKEGFVQWQPDAIWFTNSQVYGTPDYYVQSMFMNNKSDATVPVQVVQPAVQNETKKGIGGTVALGSWATTAQFRKIQVTDCDTGKILYSSKQTASKAGSSDADGLQAFNSVTRKGDWQAKKGVFTQSSKATPAFMALDNESAVAGLQNYTLELEAKKTGGDEGFLISFGVTGKKLYWWNIGGWGNTQSCIEKGTLEGRSTIGDSCRMQLATGKWYKIRIEVRGESYSCYLDGKLIHEYTDSQTFEPLYAHVGRTETGKIIIKLVNVTEHAHDVQINLKAAPEMKETCRVLTLSGNAEDENSFAHPKHIIPVESTFTKVSQNFTYPVSPYSFTILEIDEK